MDRPWRKVVHIRDCPTKRGGILWMLTLACGHSLSKYAPNPRWQAMEFRKPAFAPKKMRCWICRARDIKRTIRYG